MKVTAQEEYGLRCLLQIARAPGGCLTIHEIAAAESLSGPYVAKLMRLLRKAGYVQSIRGQKGGYRLARPAGEISVGAALAALGGHLYQSDFCRRHAGNDEVCVHDTDCAIRSLWSTVQNVVQQALGNTMLQHLICREEVLAPQIHERLGSLPGPERRA